jgi:hypothetical protein
MPDGRMSTRCLYAFRRPYRVRREDLRELRRDTHVLSDETELDYPMLLAAS